MSASGSQGGSRRNSLSYVEQLSPRQSAPKRPANDGHQASPDPFHSLKNDIAWIQHTIGLEVLKKGPMDISLKRNLIEKLNSVSAAATDIQVERAASKARIDELRSYPGDIVERFSIMLAQKDAKIDELIGKLASSEKTNTIAQTQATGSSSFAAVTGRSRSATKKRNTEAARSKSRIDRRSKVLSSNRDKSPPTAFVFTPSENVTTQAAKEEIWSLVTKVTKCPKFQSVKARSGKLVLKPQNKETEDILKNIAKTKGIIHEDSASWPRISVDPVDSSIESEQLPKLLIEQNPDVLGSAAQTDIIPIFKRGPRDRQSVKWICEVKPELYHSLLKTNLYLGFDRCRIMKHEEVTQCFKCLRYGHTAAKCYEELQSCDHCALRGHRKTDCPNIANEPKCANCRGKHRATDNTCSTRTSALASRLSRTDYGKPQ